MPEQPQQAQQRKIPSGPPMVHDRAVNFTMGIDTSKHPNLIAPGYASFAANVSFRGGKPKNRPAFHEVVFPPQEHLESFQVDKAQGETMYQDLTTNETYMVAIRGGKVLKVNLDTKVIEFLNQGDLNNTTRRHYFTQADKYLVIQNGVDTPLIWDGTTIRRSYCKENNPGIDNTNVEHVNGVAEITTATPHGLVVGDFVALNGDLEPPGYIGNYRVREVPTTTTYKIRVTSTLASPATSFGKTFRPMEVPIGTFMEFAIGRLCVVSPDRRKMHIGDIINTTPDTYTSASVLWFTEETFLAESYVFSLAADQGRIRAVKAIPSMSTATGQGDLLVSGDRGISTLSLGYLRTEWFSRPIQRIATAGVAIASQTGMVGYNGDIIFRDLEYGIRTFRLVDATYSKSPAQTPISAEVNRIFLDDDVDKLQFSAMTVAQNRLLSTVTPVFDQRAVIVNSIEKTGSVVTVTLREPADHEVGDIVKFKETTLVDGKDYTITTIHSDTSFDIETVDGNDQAVGGVLQSAKTGAEYYHRGIAVLDYTTLSGAGGAAQAAWDGIWTGLNVQTMLKQESRTFATVYNEVLFRNEVWEITSKSGPDVSEFGTTQQTCWVELASMQFESPFELKLLQALTIFFHEISGNVEGRIHYRCDGDSCWRLWRQNARDKQFEICATAAVDPVGETNPFSDGLTQSLKQRRRVRLGQPINETEVQTNHNAKLCYEAQLRIEWTGQLTIDKVDLEAIPQDQDIRGGVR